MSDAVLNRINSYQGQSAEQKSASQKTSDTLDAMELKASADTANMLNQMKEGKEEKGKKSAVGSLAGSLAKKAALGLLSNPLVLGLLLLVTFILVGYLVLAGQNDSPIGTFTSICNTLGTDTCLKTILNQKGEAVKNSNP